MTGAADLCVRVRVSIPISSFHALLGSRTLERLAISLAGNAPTVWPEATTATAGSTCSGGDRVGRVQGVEIVELDNISIGVCVFGNTSLTTRGSLSGLVYIVAVVVLMAGRSGLSRRLRRRQQRQPRPLM